MRGPQRINPLRSLAHILIDLLDVNEMSEDEMEAVWLLLRYLKRKEAAEFARSPRYYTPSELDSIRRELCENIDKAQEAVENRGYKRNPRMVATGGVDG